MNEKKTYERNCPYCGKLLTYKSRPVYNRAKRIGRGCRGCGQSVVKVDSGYKSSWNVGLTSETDDRVAYNCRNAFGKDGNVSFERKGKTYEEIYGKERAIEIKKKQTLSTNVDKWVWPKYNPKSIPIIEKYGEETGYSFKHAENGGEVDFITESGNRYFVDGYDSENNVIVEFYENHHQNKKQKEYDLIRERELISLLDCKFIIIKDNNYENIIDKPITEQFEILEVVL
jgi:hypothetical protein